MLVATLGGRMSIKLASGLLLLSAITMTTGCTRRALPIAVFAAAAAVQTVQAVDAYCSQEDVDCTQGGGSRTEYYESNDDPYSTGVDW